MEEGPECTANPKGCDIFTAPRLQRDGQPLYNDAAATSDTPSRRVLMLSSNGVGLGHITRQLAAAHRLKLTRPVFLTMSYAADIIRAAGFPVQFLAHHGATG